MRYRTMKPYHNVVEPLFDSEEYQEYMDTVPILKRISIGFFSWAGDGVPNDAHFWGKQDFLTDPQFQGDSEINYFRKTNTDLVTFLQTEGWLCLVRIRKVLRMLNELESYEQTIESLSRNAGYPVDSWGNVFEKMHPAQCRCAPCSALCEVKKQLEKKNIAGQEVTQSVIHHIRRCVYRVLISGVDRIFETFCSRRFSIVWFILSEEFDEHYRDTEFEKLCSLIMNDIVAIEPLTSVSNFSKTLLELYEGATDLARAVLHKFAVILGSQKMFYTSSMNFIMFYIDSFNMIIRMLRWLGSKFRVFNQLANGISHQSYEDKLDFKSLLLHAMNELVYSTADVANRREAALKVIGAYQKLQKSYFGPNIGNLERYLDYIDATLFAATSMFQMAKLPCKCPTFKVPKKNVIDAALYINPYREDQFDAPQVFHCYWQDRFIIERSQTPWKILYNNKAKILLRLSVENPADKSKKLAINVFLAEENPTAEDRIKDQYFALYESRLERLVDFFDVLKQEVIEYYSSTHSALNGCDKPRKSRKSYGKTSCRSGAGGNSHWKGAACRSRVVNGCSNVTKISVPVKIKRPDRRSRYSRDKRMQILSSLMQKHRQSRKPSTIENLEQLLTFAVKTGVEGSGMLPELTGDAKDVYVSITSVDKTRRAKADQEFSLHELMSFIIFWYARHGCVTEFEGHTLHRTTFGCTKQTFKDSFPLLYKAAEELDVAVGEGLLSENDLSILEKGLSSTMTEEEIRRCRKGLETTLLMKREFNELVQSKRAFAKLSSAGFCVTLGPGADGASVLTAEADCRKLDPSLRKAKGMTKVPEIRNRMRKTLEERQQNHNNCNPEVQGPCPRNIPVKALQNNRLAAAAAVLAAEEQKERLERKQKEEKEKKLKEEAKKKEEKKPEKEEEGAAGGEEEKPEEEKETKEWKLDVDELVQIIEGTHIRHTPERSASKAAKKQRQKEKKEQERQRLIDERLKEEAKRRREELRKLEEERRKLEQEEKRKKEELVRKQKEAAELKKEELRKKKMELERKKAEEKKQKKDAKKQRREQRKKEMEGDDEPVVEAPPKPAESFKKTEAKKVEVEKKVEAAPEKEFGRLKHEKEQRKREEEEARRLEQLQAQERVQANKKNKKKKKKQKQNSETQLSSEETKEQQAPETKPVTVVGQPLVDLLSGGGAGANIDGKPADKNNLVTIRKHMDSSVTISLKGKEGEEDLIYTLMNGQVYPTGHDGKILTDDALPIQQSAFGKQEPLKPPTTVPNPNIVSAPIMKDYTAAGVSMTHPNPIPYTVPTHFTTREAPSMAEIDLTQLKLPPGITITKVPQQHAGPRYEEMNGIHQSEYPKQLPPGMGNFQRSSSLGGMDNRFNSNVMVVDSRCSSLESPIIGMRQSDMMYGCANGTRPSSEASITSDRPSSGLDSICNNNGPNVYVGGRGGFQTAEMLSKRVPISMSSPYTTASRNETPSPAWQQEISPGYGGMHGIAPQMNPDRHGFWSSTPASPVAFPANSVSESYMRAQDQHFITPRPQPQPRSFHPSVEKRVSPLGPYNDAGGLNQASPSGRLSATTPPYNIQAPVAVNGSTQPGFNMRYKPVFESNDQSQPQMDQWTPWNNTDRFSPEVDPAPAPQPAAPVRNTYSRDTTTHDPFFMALRSDDVNQPWQSSACDKSAISRTVNPFGPIGSNITRRASNTSTNGIHGGYSTRYADFGRANLGGSSCT